MEKYTKALNDNKKALEQVKITSISLSENIGNLTIAFSQLLSGIGAVIQAFRQFGLVGEKSMEALTDFFIIFSLTQGIVQLVKGL